MYIHDNKFIGVNTNICLNKICLKIIEQTRVRDNYI